MNIKVELFKENFFEALSAGVYEASVECRGRTRVLYIGESVYPLVRCAIHLYEFKKAPEYFGFTERTIGCEDVTLRFSLVDNCEDEILRGKVEKRLIKEKNPLSQSGRGDSMKGISDKIDAVDQFLKECGVELSKE